VRITDVRKSEGEPHDRLTRLCAAMTDALERELGPDDEPVRAIIMLDTRDRGGMQLHGYDGREERLALARILGHAVALGRAAGLPVQVASLGSDQ